MLRILLLAATAALLLTAAPATAAVKSAHFKATLSGNQVTTWSFRDGDDPDDPCDGASHADGSQSIAFKSKSARISAFRLSGDSYLGPMLEGTATIDREGDYTQDSAPYDTELCGEPIAVGDGGGGEPPLKDCGVRDAPMTFQFSFDDVPDSDSDGIAPLVPKGSVFLAGNLGAWLGYLDCPWWIGGGEGPSEDALLQTWEPVSFKRLMDKRRKSITISADRRVNHSAPGFTGSTLITWNLRLKRVR